MGPPAPVCHSLAPFNYAVCFWPLFSHLCCPPYFFPGCENDSESRISNDVELCLLRRWLRALNGGMVIKIVWKRASNEAVKRQVPSHLLIYFMAALAGTFCMALCLFGWEQNLPLWSYSFTSYFAYSALSVSTRLIHHLTNSHGMLPTYTVNTHFFPQSSGFKPHGRWTWNLFFFFLSLSIISFLEWFVFKWTVWLFSNGDLRLFSWKIAIDSNTLLVLLVVLIKHRLLYPKQRERSLSNDDHLSQNIFLPLSFRTFPDSSFFSSCGTVNDTE